MREYLDQMWDTALAAFAAAVEEQQADSEPERNKEAE